MSVFVVIIGLLVISLQGKAGLNDLVHEFLKTNPQFKINELEKSQAAIERDLLPASKRWALAGGMAPRSHSGGESTQYNIGLTKDFEWGGQLKLERARLDENNSSVSKESYTYTQSLGRNFFGRQFYTAQSAAEGRVQLSKVVLSQKNQEELGEFYRHYLQASLKKTAHTLQQRALQRSKKRLKDIRRRVRDGLSEKADLYSAQIEHLRKREQLSSAEFAQIEAISNLSQRLHRKVKASEVEKVSFDEKELTKPTTSNIQDNLDVKRIKAQLRSLNRELKGLQWDFVPSITLSVGRTMKSGGGGEREGLSSGDDEDESVLALGLSMPLSYNQEKLKMAHKKAAIMSSELEKKQVLERLQFTAKNLDQAVAVQLKNLDLSRQRIRLANKNLREKARLYRIGKVNFDGLIRAEEDLINTEHSYINSWLHYETTVSQKASLYGKLLETITGK